MDTEIEECGLPHWLVSRRAWSNMDSSLTIKTIRGSTRGINMFFVSQSNPSPNARIIDQHLITRQKARSKQSTQGWNKFNDKSSRKLDMHARRIENFVKSQITCHKILATNNTNNNQKKSAKLIAYQKLGW